MAYDNEIETPELSWHDLLEETHSLGKMKKLVDSLCVIYIPTLQVQSFLSPGTLLGVAAPQFESHWCRDYSKRLCTKGKK